MRVMNTVFPGSLDDQDAQAGLVRAFLNSVAVT